MKITIRELIEALKPFDPDSEIHFEELSFYRVKSRGPKLVQIEFNENPVSWDKKNNTVTFLKPQP